MAGMLIGSLANIVLDYIFIYPLGMEMAGAATATATAPVISMLIMSVHFIKKNNRFHITKIRLSLKRAADICFLGVSSLVLELSSGIVIIVFNFLILKLNGNTVLPPTESLQISPLSSLLFLQGSRRAYSLSSADMPMQKESMYKTVYENMR